MQKWFLQPETRPIWSDAQDEVLGRTANGTPPTTRPSGAGARPIQNDFAARMDWTIKPYAEANHPPVPKLGHPAELTGQARRTRGR